MNLDGLSYDELKKTLLNMQQKQYSEEEKDELEKLVNKIIELEEKRFKVGCLKHDLYINTSNYIEVKNREFAISEEQLEKLVESFKSEFETMSKGTKFYRYGDGAWIDENNLYDFEELDDDWASQHLENIKDI